MAIKSISKLPIFEDWKVRLIATQTINHIFGRPGVNPGAECFQKPPAIRHLRHRTKGELHTYHFKNHQHFENLCWKIGGRNKMNSLSCHRMKAYRMGVFIWKGTRWLSKKHVNIQQRPCRDITAVIFTSRTRSLPRTYVVGYL